MNISSRTSPGCPHGIRAGSSSKPLKEELLPSNRLATAPPRRSDPVDGFIAPMIRFVKRKPWANTQVPLCQAGETIVIAGVGLLYHVEALRNRLSPDCSIAVLIPNIQEFHDSLSTRALGLWSERITWLFGTPLESAQKLAATGRPLRCLSYTPAAHPDADFHQAFQQVLRRHIASHTGGQLTITLVGPIYGGSLPIARLCETRA